MGGGDTGHDSVFEAVDGAPADGRETRVPGHVGVDGPAVQEQHA